MTDETATPASGGFLNQAALDGLADWLARHPEIERVIVSEVIETSYRRGQ